MMKIIDFHSHILPFLDHGCKDLAQSLAQLELIKSAGTDIVVASSHFYPNRIGLSDFLAQRERSAALLCRNLPEDAPKIAVGAEVYCSPGLENMDGLESLCISGTRCMLLEMPLDAWTEAHFETVDALSNEGYTVLMAHIDRYPKHSVQRLMNFDVYAQVNASALGSFWGRRKVKKWFEEDRVFAIGSDLHGAESGGYDHFEKGLSSIEEAAVSRIMNHSACLLQNAVFLK